MELLRKIAAFPEYNVLVSDQGSISNKELPDEIEKRAAFFSKKAFSQMAISVENPFDVWLNLLAITQLKRTAIPYLEGQDGANSALRFADANIQNGAIELQSPEQVSELHTQFLDEKEAGLILTTSGTTAKPKLVLHRFRVILEKYLKLRTRLTTVLIFPLHHVSGLETLISVISAGGTVIFPSNNRPETVLKTLANHSADFISCTPSYLKLLLLQPKAKEILNSLNFINLGGEKTSKADFESFQSCLPSLKLNQAFGTTETTNLRTQSGSDGTFSLGQEGEDYLIRDNKLFLRKPKSLVGFLDETSVVDEWLETGDVVTHTAKGDLVFEGRNSRLITVGGEKVSPEEVEEVLKSHDDVLDAHVFGEENALLGQVVVANVVARGMHEKKVLRAFCRKFLPEHKIPFQIHFKDSIETSSRLKKLF